MQYRRLISMIALVAAAACVAAAFAQSPPPAGHGGDFTGVWISRGLTAIFDPDDPRFQKPDTLPMQPWAEAKFKAAKPGYGPYATPKSEEPSLECYPPGMSLVLLVPFPMEIIQAPGRIIMYFEFMNVVRQIYTDGRPHPKDLMPTYMGHSTGKWEGDTLVVDTVGLTEKSWLDRAAHPHTDQLHIVERIRRIDANTLEFNFTFDDPGAYTRPFTGRKRFSLLPGGEIMEYVCADNFIRTPRK